jgi:CRISPR-associated endonuclease Csn1
MSKKILGLDLGISSIGWAIIEEFEEKSQILGLGSRIIPLSNDDKEEFSTGNSISKNQKRTLKRTQRKGYDRYQLRRSALCKKLQELGMLPDADLMNLNSLQLYGLRDKALNGKIELKEIGRIFYHLNQKRGYKSSRSDTNLDKKDTDYVAQVKSNYSKILDERKTIGQHFYTQLQADKYFRIKDIIFPREAYIEEFNAICNEQKKYHSQLSDEVISVLRDRIIYYQRPLKSQKGLVSICEFEGINRVDHRGNEIFTGPKVTPRSSPLFQLCRIWETVNNISLKTKNAEGSKYKWSDFIPTIEQKRDIVAYLFKNKQLTSSELLKILNLNKSDVYLNKQIERGIKGNHTYADIEAIIQNKDLLQFNIAIIEDQSKGFIIDKRTGEIISEEQKYIVDPSIEKEPFYHLWHTIYSIKDLEECALALQNKFSISLEEAEKLAKLDFTKDGFGEKSSKAIRKILPYLMKGYQYSDACMLAGYNHSNSLTNDEKEKIITADKLSLLSKNSLRQPVVEKILNQMIHVVNALIDRFGKPDEIRIELARELKQSKDERNEADKQNSLNKKQHDLICKRLEELGLPQTRKMILKYKLIFPAKDKKWNEASAVNQCIYCGESFQLAEALNGSNFDVDHIIPQAMLFDDSQTNKVLVHRKCNKDKTNTTAYDYISSKGEAALMDYLNRVDDWYKRGIISYSKLQRLKTSYNDYLERKKLKKETEADKRLWESFIDRQLRESAYIARKAKFILAKVCRNVYSTEGAITAKLRKIWGWEDTLMQLQYPKFKELQLTETKVWESNYGSNQHSKEEIIGWSKRDDHRHHALDALTIACTKQGFIQRLNTLNSSEVRDQMKKEIEVETSEYQERMNLLEKYLFKERPFKTEEVKQALAKVLISFKAGKKAASTGTRKIKVNGKKQVIQRGVIIPRGALSEESVYGKIKMLDRNKPVKYLFENPHLILKGYIKEKVEERLRAHENDIKKAISSLKKDPIYLDAQKTIELKYGSCYKEEVVIKYPITQIKAKDLPYIIDKRVRDIVEARLKQFNNKEKEAFKDLDKHPVWYNEEKKIPIKTVRMLTGLSAVEAVKEDEHGKQIGFVKPGNNHHIAIYKDQDGNFHEHLCTFWHAVERKKYKLPIVIKNTQEVWNKIFEANDQYAQSFLDKLPKDGLELSFSLQQNEMFLLGLDYDMIESAIANNELSILSQNLYRVQKLTIVGVSDLNIWFRHHLETSVDSTNEFKLARRFINVRSIGGLLKEKPVKVTISKIGEISLLT